MLTAVELNLLKKHFEPDGSLRDVYIQGTIKKDWDNFIEYAKNLRYSYKVNNEEKELSLNLDSFWQQENQKLLSLYIGNIQINCHFFGEEEIELDIDVRDFKRDQDYLDFVDFIKQIGTKLAKDVIVTGENTQDYIILRYSCSKNSLHVQD